MSENAYQQIVTDTEAARRGTMPEISNHPQPAQSFGRGVHNGNEVAVSREISPNNPRKE